MTIIVYNQYPAINDLAFAFGFLLGLAVMGLIVEIILWWRDR